MMTPDKLRTEVGPIDIVYINRFGRLTLVECKLWRNPQARREVVAQILDYASAISKWSYSDLQRQVSAALQKPGNLPFQLAELANPGLDEHHFVDQVTRAIRQGNFLLIIAGDGIKDDVNAIADLVNRNAGAKFCLGLVEVGLYGLEDGKLLVQPRVLMKTTLIERTVFVTETDSISLKMSDQFGDVSGLELTNSLGESPRQAEYRSWWQAVLDLKFDDPDQESLKLYFPNYVKTPLPWPKSNVHAYRYERDGGQICVTVNYPFELGELLEHQKEAILQELPAGSQFGFFGEKDVQRFRTLRSYSDFSSEEAKKKWLIETINVYANTFRPRVLREMKSLTSRST